jgi:hypothetical protein
VVDFAGISGILAGIGFALLLLAMFVTSAIRSSPRRGRSLVDRAASRKTRLRSTERRGEIGGRVILCRYRGSPEGSGGEPGRSTAAAACALALRQGRAIRRRGRREDDAGGRRESSPAAGVRSGRPLTTENDGAPSSARRPRHAAERSATFLAYRGDGAVDADQRPGPPRSRRGPEETRVPSSRPSRGVGPVRAGTRPYATPGNTRRPLPIARVATSNSDRSDRFLERGRLPRGVRVPPRDVRESADRAADPTGDVGA